MREIKFRGKTLSGKWVYGDLVHFTNTEGVDTSVIITGHQATAESDDFDYALCYARNEFKIVIPKSVGQFTGLHDKNGKEIYEGDIIRGNCGNGEVRHLISFYDMIASFVAEMLPDNDISDYCSLWQNRQPLDVMPMPKEEEKREVKAGAIMVSLLASLDMFIYDFIEQLEAAGKYRFGNKRIVNKARDIIIHAHMKFWRNIYGIYRDCSDYNNKMDEFYRQIDECVGLHDEPLARAYSIVVAICRLQAEYRKKLVAHTYLPSFEVEKIPAMLESLGIHDYALDNIIERRVRPIIMNAEYVG